MFPGCPEIISWEPDSPIHDDGLQEQIDDDDSWACMSTLRLLHEEGQGDDEMEFYLRLLVSQSNPLYQILPCVHIDDLFTVDNLIRICRVDVFWLQWEIHYFENCLWDFC